MSILLLRDQQEDSFTSLNGTYMKYHYIVDLSTIKDTKTKKNYTGNIRIFTLKLGYNIPR